MAGCCSDPLSSEKVAAGQTVISVARFVARNAGEEQGDDVMSIGVSGSASASGASPPPLRTFPIRPRDEIPATSAMMLGVDRRRLEPVADVSVGVWIASRLGPFGGWVGSVALAAYAWVLHQPYAAA